MIYELRTYECMPGKMKALNDRFANVTLHYFEKYGITPIGFWTEEIGSNNNLVYILAFEDMTHRDLAWKAFRSDAERQSIFAESERNGPLVAKITNHILRPTTYSVMS